jgi:lysophospholipase L1-like esterase
MTSPVTTKTILCYGDSNTWGNIPRTDRRYSRDVRWPGALQNLLGKEYEVISGGLCGRTLVAEDSKKPHRTGITHLQAILESTDPIDGLIIMLGTNDIKSIYNLTPVEIAGHLLQTIEFVRKIKDLEKIPHILIVCPPPVINPETNDLDSRMVPGLEAFKVLPSLYKEIAQKSDCGFINAGDYISSSKIDGYHLDEEGHLILAKVIEKWITQNM